MYRCVCVVRGREVVRKRAGGSRTERVGGGQRTKETNLKEMTCFREVKSGELEFTVPSPWQQIHLEKPNLCLHP